MNPENITTRNYSEEEKQVREEFLTALERFKTSEYTPEATWDTIWVLSGPEYGLTSEEAEDDASNQTRERFEKGVEIAIGVTAARLGKAVSEVTLDDIRTHGPTLYYNGGQDAGREKSRTTVMQETLANNVAETEFGIPLEKITFADPAADQQIRHTGHQFEFFPTELLQTSEKLIIVSSLYHCPRLEKYVEKYFPDFQDKIIICPSGTEHLRIGRTIGEAKKIWDYFYAQKH